MENAHLYYTIFCGFVNRKSQYFVFFVVFDVFHKSAYINLKSFDKNKKAAKI